MMIYRWEFIMIYRCIYRWFYDGFILSWFVDVVLDLVD